MRLARGVNVVCDNCMYRYRCDGFPSAALKLCINNSHSIDSTQADKKTKMTAGITH